MRALDDALFGLVRTPRKLRGTWIGFQAPQPAQSWDWSWTLVCEGLELLELLARVAPQTARELLDGYLGVYGMKATAQPTRFCMCVMEGDDLVAPETRAALLHLLTGDHREPSDDFDRVKAALLTQWARDHGGRALDRAVDGRIELALEITLELDPGNLIDIQLVSTGRGALPDAALRQFNELARHGVRISHFRFVSVFHADHDAALLEMFLLGQFVPMSRVWRSACAPSMLRLCAPSAQRSPAARAFVISRTPSAGIPAVGFGSADPSWCANVVRDRADEDFVEFVLPGTGVCWAERCHVTEIHPLVRSSSHPVRHLAISHNQLCGDAARPTVELLQMIGGPLERLTVSHGHSLRLVDDGFCNTLLTSCRSLERLKLSGKVENLNWLVDAPQKCKLSRLELSVKAVDVASWSTLFTALKAHSHPLTQSLRHLRISFHPPRGEDEAAESNRPTIIHDCVDMLVENRLLQHCELAYCSEEMVAQWQTRFMAHHNEPLSEAEAPLPIRAKLAFLSAISRPQSPRKKPTQCPSSASTQLAPELTRIVFAFASIPKRRVCRMSSSFIPQS